MRKLLLILCLPLLVSGFNQSFATKGDPTEETNKNQEQQQDQEGRRKSDQSMIRPDGQFVGSNEIQTNQEEKQELDSNPTERINENSDSLRDDSVSKYNFIFYFLYKFKYDSEESP